MVSVIIPCYNGEEFLAQALQSVQWQTYENWECILVDDGSTDRSAAIFKAFEQSDSRFRYLLQQNAGPTVARNAGVSASRGEYIQFLDDDDLLLRGRFEVCANLMQGNPDVDVVNTEYVCFREGEGFFFSLPARLPEENTFINFLCEQNKTFVMLMHSLFFRAAVVKANPFDTSLRLHAEDFECWTRMAERGVRFTYANQVLAIYRFSRNSIAQDEAALLAPKVAVMQRYDNHPQVAVHRSQFETAVSYFREHAVIGLFKKKLFAEGLSEMTRQWSASSWRGRGKMLAWLFLMIFVTNRAAVKARSWIVGNTPMKWGGWTHYRKWEPPNEIKQLMFGLST